MFSYTRKRKCRASIADDRFLREARTMGIKDALQCIGGIQALFPIFSHLNPISLLQQRCVVFNKPKFINSNKSSSRSVHEEEGKSEVDTSLICLSLSFMANMLSDSPSSLEAMLRYCSLVCWYVISTLCSCRCDGIHVLGLLFEKITPSCWSKEAIGALEQLAQSVSSHEALFRQLFLSVYFNFNIWIYTDVSVQYELLDVLSAHFKRQPQYFRTVVTVQRIIDIMRWKWIMLCSN